MPKRSRNADEPQPIPKKVKANGHAPAPEEIHFARQLQDLLAFSQDGVHQLRHGIASFKQFLESILYHKNEDDRARQLSILREYLGTQKPEDVKDTERPFLAQLWQAWSFASQNNDERLSSSIASILTLLLKTLSSLIDFREHGFIVCRTILQHQHLRLVKRCLDAPKHKDFLISPALRLLTEVVRFDGGVLAKEAYKRREQTFDPVTLRRNLGMIKTDVQDEEEARRRPAIRTLTIRYILANLKYLHEGGKIDVLKSRPLCTSLFHFLRDDPAEVVNELLSVTEQHVFKDTELPRSSKAALLVQSNLERVTEIATRSEDEHGAADRAFQWLIAVCTNSSYGILRASGWYPPGTLNLDSGQSSADAIDLGLDSIEFYDRETRSITRNTALLGWIQTLKPHSNLQEREMVIACFNSAPELVAAYFVEKNMQFEPKLSNTWIGYASFLFEVVQLSAPAHLGHENELAPLPPQINIVIESILPRPLTQKVLTRCLNQSSELITFFAIRILVLAFQKVAHVRSQLIEGAKASTHNAKLWTEASERLLARFTSTCPAMKDIVAAFRKISDDADHALQREAAARLLKLYYNLTPLQALEEQFDVSSALSAALLRSEANDTSNETKELRQLELEHLLYIAQWSPGMRWLTKQGYLQFSPILTLLKMHSKDLRNRGIRQLVYKVLSDNSVIATHGGCNAVLIALSEFEDYTHIGPFLDDCFTRSSRHPVKYVDILDDIYQNDLGSEGTTPNQPFSPLGLVFLEQAPFVLPRSEEARRHITAFVSVYLQALMSTEEDGIELGALLGRLSLVDKIFAIEQSSRVSIEMEQVRLPPIATEKVRSQVESENNEAMLSFAAPPMESENHPELLKWLQKDLDMAIEEGDIDALILCLCSQHQDIQKQALTQMYKLEERLLRSAIDDKGPVYILIGELIETYEHSCAAEAEKLPYLAGCFATHALHVQANPGHFLYPKINKFLNRGPSWRINRLPNYWIENTVLSQPDEDDAYWKEVQWVLDWLVDGMRTQADLEILRKTGVFEKVMTLCSSPGVSSHPQIKQKVLELLWRVTFVEGGSTTLITRTGVLAWLDMMREGCRVAEQLKKRLLETCDKSKIEEWSASSLGNL